MPICYWELCHCPDATPCNEHQGWNCGLWNGQVVQTPQVIRDAITRDAELALIRLDEDDRTRETLKAALEARAEELDDEAEELTRMRSAAKSIGDRGVVVSRMQQAQRRLEQVDVELRRVIADLDAMNARASKAGDLISTYLIVPYASQTGYCACYDTKRARLDAIASQRDVFGAQLSVLLAQRGTVVNQVVGLLAGMPSSGNLIQVTGSLALAFAIVAYVLFNLVTAYFVFMAGLIAIVAILASILVGLILIDDAIARVRRRIVKLDLAYYRLQAISTCQKPALPAGTKPVGFLGSENAWLEELGVPEPVPEEEGYAGGEPV